MRQRRDLERIRERYGAVIVRVLELHGLSGTKTLDDAQVQQLLADLDDESIDGLAVSSIDRLLRPKRYQTFGVFDRFVDLGKSIWSWAEGAAIDPSTDEGYEICIRAASQAGSEWRRLKQRVRDGKEESRLAGGNPNGPKTLPRGLVFTKGVGYSYDAPETERIVRMFDLFISGKSYHEIARIVGNGWSHQGVRGTVKNRLWRDGTRIYGPNEVRSEELALKILPPLVSADIFDAAQVEAVKRKDRWRKSKRPKRFLCIGLLDCGCGRPIYNTCGTVKKPTRDRYMCSTHKKGRGPKCGLKSFQRPAFDDAVAGMIEDIFSKPETLDPILAQALSGNPDRREVEDVSGDIRKLEARRERILEQRADGLISREKCNEQVGHVDQELARLRTKSSSKTAAKGIDAKRLVVGLTRTFHRFRKLSFSEKRATLEEAIRTIVITQAGEIVTLTLQGGFLGSILGANLSSPLRRR
jgi:DNA invertase Pin-like site-specific DNA recombinase